MLNKLYGDGIHDDQPAIQEMLDSGLALVDLPSPEKSYRIGKSLKLNSNQELRLPRYALISLLDNSNCLMAENSDSDNRNENICISGGIWDMNHKNQWQNPYHFKMPNGLTVLEERERNGYTPASGKFYNGYSGMCFRFKGIKNFILKDLTIRNPVVYGVQMAYIEDFTIEHIVFDYTEGSPKLWNLDGIHCEGGCKNGYIYDLKGACHDDLFAITSDDGCYGPIENIVVKGIYAEKCHSAVRILSVSTPIKNIHISDIYGSFYVYCIIMSQYYEAHGKKGVIENLTLENINASLCEGTVDVPGNYEPFIAIKSGLNIRNLRISNLRRHETHCALPTIGIDAGTEITNISVNDCEQVNDTSNPFPFIKNSGRLKNFYITRVYTDDTLIDNDGSID